MLSISNGTVYSEMFWKLSGAVFYTVCACRIIDAEDPRWLCVVVEPHATFSCISTYFSSLRRRQETRYIQRVSPTPADTTDNLIPTDARRRQPAPGGREGKGMETLERGGGVMVAAGEGRKTRIRRYVCGSCESGLLSRARSPGHVVLYRTTWPG